MFMETKNIIQKTCVRHGLTDFVLRNNGSYVCKKCACEATQRRRIKVKKIAIEYKGGKCEICGYDKCVSALEFHHIDSTKKDFGISEKGYTRSFTKIKEELDKCILVCANCHREIHENFSDSKKIQDSTGIHQSNRRKIDKLNIEEILEDIKNEMKQPDIAKKYNVSVSTLKRFLKSQNIKMNKGS